MADVLVTSTAGLVVGTSWTLMRHYALPGTTIPCVHAIRESAGWLLPCVLQMTAGNTEIVSCYECLEAMILAHALQPPQRAAAELSLSP